MNVAAETIQNNRGWFASLWFGEARLVKAFYEAHIFWAILIALFLFQLMPIILVRLPLKVEYSFYFIIIPAYVITSIYFIFTYIAIWRCAFNVNNIKWGYVARLYVALMSLKYIYSIIIMFL